MYAVVRTDKMYATDNRTGLVSVRYQPGGIKLSIENGSVVKLGGLENNGTKEVYVCETPTASDSLSDIVLIATPEVMYDETKIHLSDFCNEAGSICRGYRLHSKDVFSATKEAFMGEKPEVGKFVELTSDVKLNVVTDKTGSTLVGEIVDINKVGSYTYYAVEVCTVGAQAEGDLASAQEELDKAIAELEALKNKEVVWTQSTITLSDKSVLTAVTLPDEVTNLKVNAFLGCANMTTFIGNGVKSLGGDSVFSGCSSLTEIILPELRTMNAGDYNGNQFSNCTALRKVVFPKYSGALGTRVFYKCTALEIVDILSCSNIYSMAFSDCSNLKAICIRSDTVISCADKLFKNGSHSGNVYVPKSTLDQYVTNYETYATRFRSLEDYTVDGTITGELDESKI